MARLTDAAPTPATGQIDDKDLKAAEQLAQVYGKLTEELSRAIVGQSEVLKQVLIAMFCQGHCLLEGVPGLAKTLMISNIANLLSLKFSRIQFTPDLMPADITGTDMMQDDPEGDGPSGTFRVYAEGPLFHQRDARPMKSTARRPRRRRHYLRRCRSIRCRSVPNTATGIGRSRSLCSPTQNPIEQEGTYPLPEAQLDRFMFKIQVEYPSFEEELQIAETTTSAGFAELESLLDSEDILHLQQVVRKVLIGRSVSAYAVRLVRSTRPKSADSPDFIKKYLTWGAGPRACQSLLLGAKANALLDGRVNVSIDDIRYVAYPVLRHRLVTGFSAESDGLTTDHIIEKLIDVTRED